MKKIFLVLAGMVVLGGSAQAKQKPAPAPELPRQSMMICDNTMGSMCPTMEMMPVLLQVMKLQQKLDTGVSGSERKEIIADKGKLIDELDAAMVRVKSLPMPCISQPMPCVPPPKK